MVRVRLTMADWDGNETSALRKIFGGSPWCSRGLVLYTADTRDRARVDNRLRSLTSWPCGMTTFRATATGLAEQHTVRFPDGDREVLARPGRAVDRLTLREILLAGLDGMVRLGKEFTRYELLPTGEVQAYFADGSAATGDLLVGADGVNSRVRQQLLPEVILTDTGTRWLGGRTP